MKENFNSKVFMLYIVVNNILLTWTPQFTLVAV